MDTTRGHVESKLKYATGAFRLPSDKGKVTALVLPDLTAAFDTVVHNILLARLETDFGVSGVALSWFRSNLCGRSQSVSCDVRTSSSRTCGGPTGSVHGPMVFASICRRLSILQKYDICYHLFADETQLHLSFDQKMPY